MDEPVKLVEKGPLNVLGLKVKVGRRISQSCLLAFSGFIVACGSSDEPALPLIEHDDSAGIDLVHVLRAPPDTLRLQTPDVRIGSVGMDGNEREVFDLITDIAVLPDDRIAVVDNRGARVAVFDSSGEWLYDIGRRGEGPGEYTAPIYASTLGDTLFLWDALQRRLGRYQADGTFLGSVSLPNRTSAHPFEAVAGGYVNEVESGQLMDPAPARGALVRTERDGEAADTLVGPFPVPESGWVITDEDTGSGYMTNPPAFGVAPPWTTSERHLIWLDPVAAVVEVRSLEDGALVRQIRLPYVAEPPGNRDREIFFQSLQEELDLSDEMVARERAGTEFAELRPPVAGVVADGPGRVWVAEHDPAARSRNYIGSGWDVIDAEQDIGLRVEFPTGFELKEIRGGRAYGISTLESGVHVVDVFTLRDGQL